MKKQDNPYYKKGDIIGNFLRKARTEIVYNNLKGRLLDIACGDNILVRHYGNESIGVDFMDFGNADLIVKNYENLPIEDEEFDTVTIIASLNYFDDPVATLRECKRVMKSDGRLLITMPNKSIMGIWHMLRERWAKKSGFSKKELEDFFNQAGMKLTKRKSFLFGMNFLYIVEK